MTAASGDDGTIMPPSQTVVSGSTASFTVTPDPTYHVVSVSGDTCTVLHVSGNNWTSSAISADCAVIAKFALSVLVFTTQPANVAQGNALGTVVVAEQDGNGNTIIDNPAALSRGIFMAWMAGMPEMQEQFPAHSKGGVSGDSIRFLRLR